MPISASAKKSLRVAERRTAENRVWKLRIKNQLKTATSENVSDAVSLLDKAAKNHVIHKNKAARLKSRLMKRLAPTAVTPTVTKAKAPTKRTTKKTSK